MEGRVFQYSLVMATVLPFLIFLLPESAVASALIFSFSVFAGAHVPSTAYLFFSKDVVAGVPHWRWTIVAAPLVLMVLLFLFLFAMPTWALIAFMFIYIHFGMWHF